MAEFDIISFNVKGLRDYKKRRKIFNYAKKYTTRNGIVFFQETHPSREIENTWANQWGGKVIYSHGSNDNRGVLIAFREGLDIKIENEIKDTNRRVIILKACIQGSDFLLINIYNANVEKEQLHTLEMLDSLIDRVNVSNDIKVILGGDLNFHFNSPLEADGGKPSLKLSLLALFEHLAKKWDLCDIWCMRNPDCKRFTYRQKTPFLQRRLDYFLISDELQESISKADVLPSLRSDHSPIYMKYVDSQSSM